ncbi:putative beta-lactamase precursor (penicillin-binding protein) [Sphingopyxis fribergensis]|uniref:Putative beta-lactamase (Penicillin-binding protein) n=1 Tax=Sphingopyxis fribergensis TaxID=1515612 RepID=A0A0A7PKJ1_9SPHN|nr:serine hydrolase domain-containing protein [Sphingopyxis fribergensis]AJA10509.1 putative beta-lactamase precursor (penicillin-binding protein) [Sphingopyxis fribergensis]
MRWKSGFVFAFMFAGAVPAVAQDSAPKTLDQLAPEIDALFARFQTDQHVPGVVYGVVKDGKLAYVKGIGVQNIADKRAVTPDSLFRIASMTKAFTALSILKLRDDGKLRLDDLAEQYVPEMKGWTYPTTDSPRIRVRDLLHHVGGLVTDDPWGDRQQILPQDEFTKMIAAGVPFSRAPQSSHEYSNFGYALLGRIVANASGMPYRDYVRRTILIPLGMGASGFDSPNAPKARYALGYRWENERWSPEPEMADGAFNAMGGLQVSANDYAKWVAFLLSAWPARDDPDTGPVKRSTVREIAQGLNFVTVANRIGASGAMACKQAAAYGMGWRVAQDCDLGLTLAHGGGYPGYGSHVMLMPDHGVGVFALSNRTYAGPAGPAWDTAVLMDKAGLLEARSVPVSPAVADAYAAVRAAYAAGDLGPLQGKLAMNFLLDRSADNWKAELAKLKAEVGACPTDEPLAPMGAMSTAFRLNCEKGKLDGILLLAPTTPATIQALRLRVVPPDAQ